MHRYLLRGSRVVLHTVVGGVLLVAGLVMLLTPGPGIVTLVLGLAILAREYRWADRLKHRLVGSIRDASTAARARLAARRGRQGAAPDTLTELPDRAGRADPPADDDPDGRMRSAS